MSFSQPSAPNAIDTANQQQSYNTTAARNQNQINSYDQTNPFGSQTYIADPNSPSGYRLNTSLAAPMQSLFDTQTGTINNAATNSAGMYSNPFDLNAATGATAGLLNSWNQKYTQPIFDQQNSNLDAQLQNQGLAPGSAAYNNAKNLLARNQGDVTNQYLTQNEGQAFNQALQQYQLPLQTISALKSTVPVTPTFGATPTSTDAPPNYQQAAQNQFADQQTQFQNTMGGLGQLAGGVTGMFGGQGMFGANGAFPKGAGLFGGGWG